MVWDLLAREICSDDLGWVANKLWQISKQDNGNISPVHRQSVKRRTILVTEDPKLHLVWIYDRIFIKPLPQYIGSYAFWQDYLCAEEVGGGGREQHIRRAALGYLRTYYYLVKHESDLRIAQDPNLCLVPPNITWKQFCDFTSSLGDIADGDASLRYTYGEIRLTRLSFYAPLLLGKSHFQRVEYQCGPTLRASTGRSFSVGDDGGGGWKGAALWISVTAIVSSCSLIFILGLLLVYKVAKEWKFAIRDRLRLMDEKRAAE
ncbi:hypothetical protein FOCG_17559 [Fusarium oxysporum f. sp. radicis-lycopersici 26381]|nr:hypothetical protein FOCG_17559 [Fusarium oxysporum f. sp. radicis-lycopersici 26381]